ncbi:MAG: hypothetical protein Q8936_02865 [Bacillota bacterium]|nr:hypothetical protein [Bacillota bacterium]
MDKLIASYNNWCKNSGVFECYVKSTTLASLTTVDSSKIDYCNTIETNPKNIDTINSLCKMISSDLKDNTFLISDLPAEENLDLSLALNNSMKIKPILSFNHIAHDFGLIGNSLIHNKLVNYSFKFKNIQNVLAYCFILDNGRYFNSNEYLNPLVFNNQYEITEEELPYVEVLAMAHIKNLIFIYRNEIKEDVKKYLDYLQEENINISFINLNKENAEVIKIEQ